MRRRWRDVAIAVIFAVAGAAYVQWWDLVIPSPGAATYQAVFLANGQTYFGRYHDRLGPYAKIDGGYYIQQGSGANGQSAEPPRLVQRGTELHAPEPRMLIAKSAILFVEDLDPASPVARFMDQDARK